MRIAYCYPKNRYAAWSIGVGAVRCLKRLGHKVLDCPNEGLKKPWRYPTKQDYLDLCIISGPEHLRTALEDLEKAGEWPPSCPVIGWLQESMQREDFTIPLGSLRRLCTQIAVPSKMDADKFHLPYVPFGVDLRAFYMKTTHRPIKYGFIGSMYPLRQAFFERISCGLKESITCGSAIAETIRGYEVDISQELYCRSLNEIEVFLVLPSLSKLPVTKVFEAAACGCKIVAPDYPGVKELIPSTMLFPYLPESEESFLEQCIWASSNVLQHSDVVEVRGRNAIELRLRLLIKLANSPSERDDVALERREEK